MNTKNLINTCQQENISNAIRSLTEEAKGGVLSLTDKVDKNTVIDILREKHPGPCKSNLN